MTNKASLLLAALLVIPAAASAQTPSTPATPPQAVAPGAGPTMMKHHLPFSPADMAKMKAQMATMEAAHKAVRAKILAALTPAHRALLADLVGQLAIAANPDPEAARAKLDAALSASEKTNILAIHNAAMAQMHAMMPGIPGMHGGDMQYKRVMVVKDANGTTTTTTSDLPGDEHQVVTTGGAMPMMHTRHAMTAGEVLMHLAGGGEGFAPMMMLAPPMAPAAPAPLPTP